jgi:hypothetical protein
MRFPACPPRPRYAASLIGLWLLWMPSSAIAAFTNQGNTIFRDSSGALYPTNGTNLDGFNISGRSASLADIDNDGDLDLLFQANTISSQTLFLNNNINVGGTASNTFTNVTLTMWTPGQSSSQWSAAWGDYDSDGKVDVLIGQDNNGQPRGRLMRNTGSGFTDVSVATGLNYSGFAQNLAWVDINNDHLLDMVIGMENGQVNQIYLQDATHHFAPFAPVAPANSISNPVSGRSYGMAIGDADGDGDLDIYMSPCLGDAGVPTPKAYYKNTLVESGAAKTLSFTDVAASNGTQNVSKGYGSEFVDFDNDGKLDLYATGANRAPTKIYKNLGGGQFVDVDTITGHALLPLNNPSDINDPSNPNDLNGAKAIDYDNDGDLDLFFHDNLSGTSNVRLYRNDGNWQFTEVTTAQGITNTGAGGYDGTWGDIDRDGDLDLINPNNSTQFSVGTGERVYINDASTNGNHWLYVKLKGPAWDTTGIGSSLYATINDGTPQKVTLRREANTNADTFNQSDLPVHFGLGSSLFVNELLIRWPDGTAQVLNTILSDQYLTVTYFPGDYNGDNQVNARDYIVWQKGLGTDFTMDDYTVWRSHFGAKLTPGSGSVDGSQVPEPAAIVLFGLGCAALGATRRFR